jgi:hypothetical protein
MKTPTIETYETGYRVEIAPKCFLRWHTEPSPEGDMMVVKIMAPALLHYARIDAVDNQIALLLRYLPQ